MKGYRASDALRAQEKDLVSQFDTEASYRARDVGDALEQVQRLEKIKQQLSRVRKQLATYTDEKENGK